MDIKELLKGYERKMVENFRKAENDNIKQLAEQDPLNKAFYNLKKLIREQYESYNAFNKEEELFSKEELELVEQNIDLPFSCRLTEETKKFMETSREIRINKENALHSLLQEVYLLATYLETSEEITQLLKSYKIINEQGKMNMELM